jgi:hypothetical protein
MPTLDKRFFAGDGEIDPGECAKLEVRNTASEVESALSEFGWTGGPAACVVLTLSADNKKVEKGNFVVVGAFSDFKEEITKIWPGSSDGVLLRIKFKTATVFQFTEGGLTSNLTHQDNTEHAFYAQTDDGAPEVILEAEYPDYGIGEFCTKLVCNVSKNSSVRDGIVIKYTLLLFPLGKEDLLEKYPAAKEAAWPGLVVLEGECPLMVRPTAAWGSPAWPLLQTGTSLERQPQLPSGEELRAAMGAVMANATAPESSRTAKSLLSRWKKLAASPEDLVAKKAATEWPKPQQGPNEAGKKNLF